MKSRHSARGVSAFLAVASVLLCIIPLCACETARVKAVERVALPSVIIETENSDPVTDRENYVVMSLKTDDGTSASAALGGGIRGRGNSTWDFCDKKSYKIKLDEKAQLFGLGGGSNRDWVLIANAREKSLLRNYAAFMIAERMGFDWVCDSCFVSLYMNGEYLGIYQLCEQVEAAKSRIDIDETWHDGDCGFLVELDKRAKSEASSDLEWVAIEGFDIPFSIKSDIVCGEQRDRIEQVLSAFDEAVMSGERSRLEDVADLRSIVDMFILDDFTKNRDIGFASFYIYRDAGGKVVFSAPWDFDLSLGNDTGEDRGEDYASTKGSIIDLNRWFGALAGYEWFADMVSYRWLEVRLPVLEVIEEVRVLGYSMRGEAEKNYDKWDIMGKKQLFEPFSVWIITDYTKQVDYLCKWMTKRVGWLDDSYGA